MILDEIIPVGLVEYGRRGFPGYSKGLFGRRHYQYMVMALNRVNDAPIHEWLTDWMTEVFQRDNPKFKPALFKQAVKERRRYSVSPNFQQRHFFYLAQWVKGITDPAIRDYVRNWLASEVGGTNGNFQRQRWDQYSTPPMNEYGRPGFGSRGHGGFGKKLFGKSYYHEVAFWLHSVSDELVRQHLIKWFEQVFTLDNPNFQAAGFEEAVASNYGRHSARWQQRHFYFLAHEIAEIADPEERTFICEWLGRELGANNEYFLMERWREYCHLSKDNTSRRYVQHSRAKARGDAVIPETPWQETQRLEREASTAMTAEEWHQHATSHVEATTGKLAGHDLVYLRKPDGEYVIYDKTTGEEHWSINVPNHIWRTGHR